MPSIQEFVKQLPTEDYYSTKLKACLEAQKQGKGQCVNTKACKVRCAYLMPAYSLVGVVTRQAGVFKIYLTYNISSSPTTTKSHVDTLMVSITPGKSQNLTHSILSPNIILQGIWDAMNRDIRLCI